MGEIPVTYEEGAALLKEHGSVRKAVESLTWSNIKTVAQEVGNLCTFCD
jgi:hypothetical protein